MLMCFVHQRIIFQGKKVKIFTFAYGQAGSGVPPITVSLTVKKVSVFVIMMNRRGYLVIAGAS